MEMASLGSPTSCFTASEFCNAVSSIEGGAARAIAGAAGCGSIMVCSVAVRAESRGSRATVARNLFRASRARVNARFFSAEHCAIRSPPPLLALLPVTLCLVVRFAAVERTASRVPYRHVIVRAALGLSAGNGAGGARQRRKERRGRPLAASHRAPAARWTLRLPVEKRHRGEFSISPSSEQSSSRLAK